MGEGGGGYPNTLPFPKQESRFEPSQKQIPRFARDDNPKRRAKSEERLAKSEQREAALLDPQQQHWFDHELEDVDLLDRAADFGFGDWFYRKEQRQARFG